MIPRFLHNWPTDFDSAVALQQLLRRQVVLRPLPKHVTLVAGADVSYHPGNNLMHAGVVLLRLPDLTCVCRASASTRVSFPYVPGFLSFREVPALIEAFRRLEGQPDVVICDGQGIAHMRGVGLASHIGLVLGVPSVGCAKSRLVGTHHPVAPARGRRSCLRYQGRVVGSVVRTREGVNPVYVSPGHLADIPTSVRLVLRCATRFRLPEPIRAAHSLVNCVRKGGR